MSIGCPKVGDRIGETNCSGVCPSRASPRVRKCGSPRLGLRVLRESLKSFINRRKLTARARYLDAEVCVSGNRTGDELPRLRMPVAQPSAVSLAREAIAEWPVRPSSRGGGDHQRM